MDEEIKEQETVLESTEATSPQPETSEPEGTIYQEEPASESEEVI
jgi:hypothetical protein